MSYVRSHSPMGEVDDGGDEEGAVGAALTVDEARYVDYELPKKRFELEVDRFEHERSMVWIDLVQAVATGVIPILAVLGIIGNERAAARRRV